MRVHWYPDTEEVGADGEFVKKRDEGNIVGVLDRKGKTVIVVLGIDQLIYEIPAEEIRP